MASVTKLLFYLDMTREHTKRGRMIIYQQNLVIHTRKHIRLGFLQPACFPC